VAECFLIAGLLVPSIAIIHVMQKGRYLATLIKIWFEKILISDDLIDSEINKEK
jgi:hypothetical protein